MAITKLLIANRGEIAIRVARAAAELGIRTLAIYSEDDSASLHRQKTDQSIALEGRGPAAYLDMGQISEIALREGCDAVHPGYGFLSENGDFAQLCADKGLVFVGPSPDTLWAFGDKAAALRLAKENDVPIGQGTEGPTSLEGALAFYEMLGSDAVVMIKAIGGGGGRGMRIARTADELRGQFETCEREAATAFGNGALYVEEFVPQARHVEVQIIGDGTGAVSHLWERDCSLQRQNQKIIEIAPAPALDEGIRQDLIASSVRMAEAVKYKGLGTFEYLVRQDQKGFIFIEANARLQVEHTITEEVTGVDLVQAQLAVAGGETLRSLNLQQDDIPGPRGSAIQVRVNTEKMANDGTSRPTGGVLSAFEVPTGPGVRTDTFGYAGYQTNPSFDSLLAKVICHSAGDFSSAVVKTRRALSEFRLEGVETNIPFLQSLLQHEDVRDGNLYTQFIPERISELVDAASDDQPLYFATSRPSAGTGKPGLAGVKVDSRDPLAVLAHGKSGEATPMVAEVAPPATDVQGPDGTIPISSELQGTIVSISVQEGDTVRVGEQLFIMEAMKMEHVVSAVLSGVVRQITVQEGDAVFEGHPLLFIEEADVEAAAVEEQIDVDLDYIRPDLEEVFQRHHYTMDEARPKAVERRRKTNQRTARENVDDLCDPGTFIDYGAITIAAQRRRRDLQDLIENTPGDGMVAGIGSVNGDLFGEKESQCAILSYDYTVLAGTQGLQNHRKKDRMFEVAEKWKLPVVFFTEGGGGRPGDTDGLQGVGLDCWAFHFFGKLSGLVPLVGINSGRCFAGNAALLGCCDVVIATENSNIGMGGPAMIEGGGLGVFRPDEIGSIDVQRANGVVDIVAKDEEEAVRLAKKYLSYFQGPVKDWSCADQRLLRSSIPENRLRIYDVRNVIETMADEDSVLELRRDFGHGMITSLARIEGRSIGIVANNPGHLAGAIDSDAADKAARFMQLCDGFDIPLLFLCDTPGIMVGPEVEKTALVRHAARMFVTAGSLTVPYFTIILRKGYGLGAQAMAGGSFKAPLFCVSWPTGEFGGMGLEGAVKLGYRKELEAETDPEKRVALYDKLVARMYTIGKAVNVATNFEIDDVIDPMTSRDWILSALRSAPAPLEREGKKRPFIDTW